MSTRPSLTPRARSAFIELAAHGIGPRDGDVSSLTLRRYHPELAYLRYLFDTYYDELGSISANLDADPDLEAVQAEASYR